ncbi:MAG: (2Fe-2S)-binding protein [Alphaproteobacteria bacterium]|nr:(2Fe-2S)-binding protein [Alphaproteobacteria bacterium]
MLVAMIVCSCRVISDREIRIAAACGALRSADVFRRCGSRPQCGSCLPMIREMLAAVRPEPALAAAD